MRQCMIERMHQCMHARLRPDAKLMSVLKCMTTCKLRFMYLQYVVKKNKCEAVPDKAREDQGNHLASPHRIVQDHLFLMQPECGEKPEATVMKAGWQHMLCLYLGFRVS